MEDLREIEKQLDIEFGDYSLLARALTHSSFLNENLEAVIEEPYILATIHVPIWTRSPAKAGAR